MSTTSQILPTFHLSEDQLQLASTVLAALVAFAAAASHPIIPGLSNFWIVLGIGAFLKALPSLAQNPKSAEDWLLIAATVLGFVSTTLSSNPSYAEYGLAVGYVLKAVVGLSHGINVEDGILAAGFILSAVGVVYANPSLAEFAAIFATIGKSLGGGGDPKAPVPPTTAAPTT